MRYPSKKAKRRAEFAKREAERERMRRCKHDIDRAQSLEELGKAMGVPLGPRDFMIYEHKR